MCVDKKKEGEGSAFASAADRNWGEPCLNSEWNVHWDKQTAGMTSLDKHYFPTYILYIFTSISHLNVDVYFIYQKQSVDFSFSFL